MDMDNVENIDYKTIKQLEIFVIKDVETNKYFCEKDIWRENSFYLTRDICLAWQFDEKEDAINIIADYKHHNLKVIKIKISYEEVEED